MMIFEGANPDPPQDPPWIHPGFGKLQMATCTLFRAVPLVGGKDVLRCFSSIESADPLRAVERVRVFLVSYIYCLCITRRIFSNHTIHSIHLKYLDLLPEVPREKVCIWPFEASRIPGGSQVGPGWVLVVLFCCGRATRVTSGGSLVGPGWVPG